MQYTPMKCFNNCVQSALNTRREGDKNPNSSVVAETMELLANSSFGYQIMDRGQHTVKESTTVVKKTFEAINNKLFKCLG